MLRNLFAIVSLSLPTLLWSAASVQAAEEPFMLQKGDHICIVGNTLAERMQHFGWLETLIHARFPEHNLVFRNLGYSGDEIDGWQNFNHRLRSKSFGSHDEWLSGSAPCPNVGGLSKRDLDKVRENRFELTQTKADVIFAFYGYNESFAGEAGLAKFQENVAGFIQHTLEQKYNGQSAPRLVLFSPIAHEFIDSPNLPSKEVVAASNARLKMYSQAMGEVAKANGVTFVDLFTLWNAIYSEYLNDSSKHKPEITFSINGVHPNSIGDSKIAWASVDRLFGRIPNAQNPASEPDYRELIRHAVLDKNFYWFNRYRVTDGFSTYGERAFLKFSEGPGGYGDGLSNYSVGQRELDVLDQLTSNRDVVVWATAKAGTHSLPRDPNAPKPDPNAIQKAVAENLKQLGVALHNKDSNLSEFIPVITNKPGPLEGGKHLFLSGQEAIEKMTVHKNMKVELFADETMFPELVKPVQMSFDTKGRLWVACWRTYPHWKPTEKMDDRLLILEDTNHDGKADVCKTFAGDIHNPTGFEFWNGGVLVAQGPDLLFLKDTDGDDKYDIKERLVHGFDTADTHHTINSFVLDPGGAVYMQEGTFHHSQIETPWGPPRRLANGGVFRYEPRTQKTDIYVTFGFANPHGHVFDAWGQDIVVDGTGANPTHGPMFSSQLDYPNKHNRPPQVYQQRTRPCSAIEILSSSHFPEEHRGNLLVANVIGFQGILQYRLHGSSDASREISRNALASGSAGDKPNPSRTTEPDASAFRLMGKDEGSSLGATEVEPIVFSSDANFRPGDVEVGPDGAIYFTDWQNPIIGHMQHNLRDPSRDHDHGRVYRVTYVGRELVKPAPIAGQKILDLLDLLADVDDRVRYRARIELSGRSTAEVISTIDDSLKEGGFLDSLSQKVLNKLEDTKQRLARSNSERTKKTATEVIKRTEEDLTATEHYILECLWLHQSHNVVSVRLLEKVLTSPDHRARAAAVRVIAAWHDRLPNALDLLRRAAADESPRVRLMALWAASFIPSPEAAEVVLIANEQPSDQYLDFLSKEVLRTLQPLLDNATKGGQRVAFKSEAGARYFLKGLSNDDLLKEKRDRLVLTEMLYRPGLRDEHRREAIREIAKLDQKPELRVIMDGIASLDGKAANVDTSVVFDLVRQLTGQSASELTTARAELEKLATSAKQPIFRQIGYVSLINVDDNVDAAWKLATTDPKRLVDFVNAMPLISDASVRATLYDRVSPLLNELPEPLRTTGTKGTQGRFIRVELPGNGTLTLAEVEVFSGGVNVARKGRASQKNTGAGGDASRAIDGNKSGIYGDGGQTHTEENTGNPYWEVDLGDEHPIDQIVIYNRTEIPDRLANFTLKVLDEKRAEVFKSEKNPAPPVKAEFTLQGGGPESLVRRAAMNALTIVRGQEPKTFAALSKFVKEDVDRLTAIRSLQRLPKQTWPKEDAPALLNVMVEAVKKIPAKERTQSPAIDMLEFGDALASLLPAADAKLARATLGELGIRVIKIGTVFEKMSYDKDIIAVQAGKPVEFILDNSDLMPHNLAITLPGALEEIGLLSEANAQKPGFAEKHYIPDSPKILAKSTLLQPRDSQRLSFNVPKQPGIYPIVCTYPGHWRRMYAALYVVADLDAYEAAPDAYLATNKIEAVDPLLKDHRPRTEWKFEDFATVIENLDHAALGHGEHDDHSHRSYGNGKQMFVVGACVGCHKLEGQGREFGPDLSKLDEKLKPSDILKELLDPSAKINEKFQSNTIELGSGKVVTGLVIEETPDVIKLVENPLVSVEPLVIKRGDVVERVKSKTSIMPKGLMDKLTRDEILDLVSYLTARGNKEHAIFKGGHNHVGGGH